MWNLVKIGQVVLEKKKMFKDYTILYMCKPYDKGG